MTIIMIMITIMIMIRDRFFIDLFKLFRKGGGEAGGLRKSGGSKLVVSSGWLLWGREEGVGFNLSNSVALQSSLLFCQGGEGGWGESFSSPSSLIFPLPTLPPVPLQIRNMLVFYFLRFYIAEKIFRSHFARSADFFLHFTRRAKKILGFYAKIFYGFYK